MDMSKCFDSNRRSSHDDLASELSPPLRTGDMMLTVLLGAADAVVVVVCCSSSAAAGSCGSGGVAGGGGGGLDITSPDDDG